MNSVETYQKRLREEVSLVEQEIESHNQQIESLNTRLEGLKRALELCDSEQIAVAELLRTGVAGLQFDTATSRSSAPSTEKALHKSSMARGNAPRNAQRGTKSSPTGARSSNGGMRRVDMIAAVLKRHPRLTVRELIVALERQFGWKCGESNLTAHLYTNPDRFVHTKADRAGKQLVTWSVR